ncbi:hypothetical protein LguiB_011895 [Lonicera macranthoides]
MAIQVHNFPKKNFGESSIHTMPHFSVNSPAWWNSPEQQFPMSLSKNLSLKVGSTPELRQEPKKHLGVQAQEQDSSSTQLTGQSHQEVTAVGGTDSQDQCISSDSVQDKSHRKRVEGQMKPVLFMGNPAFGVNNLQVDVNPSINHIPCAYADPFAGGLYTAYGPPAILDQILPQTGGIAPPRVPLPLDLAEDGPIYVNAKQYHGILRRRQVRAKLEAQNKLVKNRKPYLHESRHRHALNRVRGSGGRFLSTKKSDPTNSGNGSGSTCFSQREFEVHQLLTGESPATSGISHAITADSIFQTDRRFSGISPRAGVSGGGIMHSGAQNRAPVVR